MAEVVVQISRAGGDIYVVRGKQCATVGPFTHGFVTCYDNPLDRDMPCTPPPKTGGG